jgi:hypothetical protein
MRMFKSNLFKLQLIILCIGLLFAYFHFIPNANAAGNDGSASPSSKRIVKWVDAQGATHYGDKLPAQEAGRNNTEISNQGIVVKRNVKADTNAEQQDQEKLAAQRKDNILLASYTKVEEIDLARDRNLEMDQATLQALSVQKENVANRTARNEKTAASFRKRNKPLPPYLNDELKQAKTEIGKLDQQIAERKLSMEATRKRFADEKARFIALKQNNSTDASTATTAAATPAKPK